MASSVNRGFLVVADITGYTSYLSGSELEHASDVLEALLGLLIDNAKAPLAVSGLEGDAVLSYTIDTDRFQGQAFVEMIEQTYVAFRRAIELMVMNTSCDCNACANINTLDLKFLVHHGEYAIQELRGGKELVGAEVNLIHRLMKNTVVEKTGVRAYAFYTDVAIKRLGLAAATVGLVFHEEPDSDMGNVSGWVADMNSVWEANKDLPGLKINESKAIRFIEEYPLPPEQVWGYLTDPEYRAIFSYAKRQITKNRSRGRVGPGTVYECFHLDNTVSTNTVLEWQPFSRIVTENTAIKSSRFLCIFDLEPIASGTRVTMSYGPLRGPRIERIVGVPKFLLKIKPQIHKGMADLRSLMEQDIADGRIAVPDDSAISEEARSDAIAAALNDSGAVGA